MVAPTQRPGATTPRAKASRTLRVRVEARQLQQSYRSLDQLLALKTQIEHALFLTRDRVDLVLYDLTSTYFYGRAAYRASLPPIPGSPVLAAVALTVCVMGGRPFRPWWNASTLRARWYRSMPLGLQSEHRQVGSSMPRAAESAGGRAIASIEASTLWPSVVRA
jgi:hypothetical protein